MTSIPGFIRRPNMQIFPPMIFQHHRNATHGMNFSQFLRHACVCLLACALLSCNGPQQTKVNGNGSQVAASPRPQTVNLDHGVYCGFRDSQDVLWFGSNGGGLYRYDGSGFTHYTLENGLNDLKVCAIAEDRDGNIWLGTAKGFSRYDGKGFAHFAVPWSDTSSVWLDQVYPVVNPNQVMAIRQDRQGVFWLGTNGAGVYRYDGQHFTQYLSKVGKVYEDGQQHNIVLSITEDLQGHLWFTSLSHAGVSRYDGKQFVHYKTEDGLSDNFVRTSILDRNGKVWIGTHGNRKGGLDRFDDSTFTTFYKTDDGLPRNEVIRIMEDRSGKFWVGSGTGPLTTFDGQHFQAFKTPDGQSFDSILCMVEDAQGNLWLGSHEGLWRLSPQYDEVLRF